MTDYKEKAKQARLKVLSMIYKAQSSHIGSNFSCIDIMTVLFDKMNLDKDLKPDRDRAIFKSWAAASVYYFLSEKGVIPKEDLETYCKPDSPYMGVLEPTVRGIELGAGAMGHGLPVAVGMALANKRSGNPGKVYVLASDGEMDIGTTWESSLLGAHHKLDNLIVIVDKNGLQAMGKVGDILNLEPLDKKWDSFGWNVLEIDGHSFNHIEWALTSETTLPKVIIANTIKGKGVSFMENDNAWHYRNIPDKEYQLALKELNE